MSTFGKSSYVTYAINLLDPLDWLHEPGALYLLMELHVLDTLDALDLLYALYSLHAFDSLDALD